MGATPEIRLGVIGGGWVGRQHIEAFARLPGVELTAFADSSLSVCQEIHEKYGFRHSYAGYNEMIAQGEVDAVVIALPTWMHKEASVAALSAGLHVLCEKPPTNDGMEMRSVVRAAEKAKATYMFARQSRYSPGVLAARKHVADGALGKVYAAEGRWLRARWDRGFGTWRNEKARGGGVLLDLGVHIIDELWFVMGCPDPVEASGGLYAAFKRFAPANTAYDADDAAFGNIRFADGSLLSFSVSFALNVDPGRREDGGLREWTDKRLYGEEGGLDLGSGDIVSGDAHGIKTRKLKVTAKKDSFDAQAEEFVRAIREGDEPLSSLRQAQQLMRMLDALRRSSERGHAVKVRS